MFLGRKVLNQSADGHDEKPASETEQSEQRQHCSKLQSRNREAQPEKRQAYRAKRNQSVFNLSAGQKSCGQASHTDSDGYGRLQEATARRIEVQYILAIEQNVELQQRGDEKEVRVSGDGEPQHPVAANQLHWRPDVNQRRKMKWLSGICRRHAADSETGQQP